MKFEADLGTAPSRPAYETGTEFCSSAGSTDLVECSPYREPTGDRFSPAPRMNRSGLVDCTALAAAPVNVRCRSCVLAGREGVEPSRASFGDSSDLRITTYVGATGGIRTRTSALATRQSTFRLPTAHCPGGIRTLTLTLNRRSHCRDCATGHHFFVVHAHGGAGSRTLIRCLQDSNPNL
jgi:hypothetical protein